MFVREINLEAFTPIILKQYSFNLADGWPFRFSAHCEQATEASQARDHNLLYILWLIKYRKVAVVYFIADWFWDLFSRLSGQQHRQQETFLCTEKREKNTKNIGVMII